MRCLLPLVALLPGLAGCGHPAKQVGTAKAAADTLAVSKPMPVTWQPEAFLDSLAQQPLAPLVASATHYADSIFTHQPQLSRIISPVDRAQLLRTRRTGYLDIQAARRILSDTSISFRSNAAVENDSVSAQKLVRVRYLSFGADEFGLDVGVAGHAGAAMYFFKGCQLIARHETPYIYGQSLRHYRDAGGHTVVYYLYSFERGSGIWWNQYFFYRYEGTKLVPILSELQNGNLRPGWGLRAYWLEATVQQTNPLTLKMVYNVELPDTAGPGSFLLSDSTLIQYRWNQPAGRLEGQYQYSKITRPQVLSYYMQNNDLLFCKAYYRQLKRALADSTKRPAARHYLWSIKQQYGRQQ